MWKTPALVALALAGCGQLNEVSAPAPASALDCAVREAQDRGYTRIGGDDDSAFIRMAQRLRPVDADAPPPDPAADSRPLYDPEVERQLLIRHDDGALHIQTIEPREAGTRADTPGFASDHAQEILALCAPIP